jgi:hypothetical protein
MSAAQIAYVRWLIQMIETLNGKLSAAGSHAGYGTIAKASRAGRIVTVTVGCTASKDRTCRTTVSAARGKSSAQRTVTVKGGATRRITLHLSAVRHASGHTTVRARTGSLTTSKTIR